jgi:hypothetical protein
MGKRHPGDARKYTQALVEVGVTGIGKGAIEISRTRYGATRHFSNQNVFVDRLKSRRMGAPKWPESRVMIGTMIPF